MTSTYHRGTRNPTRLKWGSTSMNRFTGVKADPTLRPVIQIHGWSSSTTAVDQLDHSKEGPIDIFTSDRYALDAVLATGRTVYRPFTGSNWGTNSTSPSVGGTGRQAIDDAIAQAAADGLPTTTVDLHGTSAGACNVMNWAWRNPTKVHRVFLQSPGFDLSYLYDQSATTIGWGLGDVSVSLRNVHGGTDKTTWLPLSADYDPKRNMTPMAVIADRCAVFSARDDEVVPWAGLVTFCSTLGIPLTASNTSGQPGGGHLIAPSKPGWHDFLPLEHFSL